MADYKWIGLNGQHGTDHYHVLGEFERDLKGNEATSLWSLIHDDRDAHLFMCVMGMAPINNVNKRVSKSVIRIWNAVLGITLVLSIITEFTIGVGSRVDEKTLNGGYSTDAFVIVFFLLFQIVTIVYSVKRMVEDITKKYIIDVPAYADGIKYAYSVCFRTMIVLTVCTLLGFFFYLAFAVTRERDASSSRLWYIVVPTALQPLMLMSSNFLLVGILFIIVVEERMTLFSIKRLIDKVQDRTITHTDYMTAHRDIVTREEKLPINLMCVTALLNTLFGIIIYILYANMDRSSGPYYAAYAVFVELSFFGRDLLFLCLILYEIVTVNEQSRILVQTLTDSEWEECDDAESRTVVKGNDKTRQSVLLAALGKPIGATIFFKQPTVGMVLFRLASTIILTVLASLRVYFMSV